MLFQILANDEVDLSNAKRNTTIVEVAIRHANNQMEEVVSLLQLSIPEVGTFTHPFLANLSISDAHKAALGDF